MRRLIAATVQLESSYARTDALGPATGDLRGATAVHVLKITPEPNGTTVLHLHPQWVTETGSTLRFDDADVTLFASGVAGLNAASFLKGVKLLGGTGRFESATGTMFAFGALDLNRQEITLRYRGQICFAAQPSKDSSDEN